MHLSEKPATAKITRLIFLIRTERRYYVDRVCEKSVATRATKKNREEIRNRPRYTRTLKSWGRHFRTVRLARVSSPGVGHRSRHRSQPRGSKRGNGRRGGDARRGRRRFGAGVSSGRVGQVHSDTLQADSICNWLESASLEGMPGERRGGKRR